MPSAYQYARFQWNRLHLAYGFSFSIALCAALIALVLSVLAIIENKRAIAIEDNLKKTSRALSASPIINKKISDGFGAFDSTQLITALHSSANASEVELSEVVYTLEKNPAEPFIRYHARLSVSKSYPQVRKFVETLLNSAPNLSLDQISCVRQAIQDEFPTCTLAISAFYRREKND